jgi:hypothetical protein
MNFTNRIGVSSGYIDASINYTVRNAEYYGYSKNFIQSGISKQTLAIGPRIRQRAHEVGTIYVQAKQGLPIGQESPIVDPVPSPSIAIHILHTPAPTASATCITAFLMICNPSPSSGSGRRVVQA